MTSTSPMKNRILSATQALILERGYNAFSFADIAAQVGIRKASIHHHFPTKADLVQELVRVYRLDYQTGLERALSENTNPRDQLAAYGEFWKLCIGSDTQPICLMVLLASEIKTLPVDVATAVRDHLDELSAAFARMLERGAASGVFHLTDSPASEAEFYMAAIHGAMLTARSHGDAIRFSRVADLALNRLTAEAR